MKPPKQRPPRKFQILHKTLNGTWVPSQIMHHYPEGMSLQHARKLVGITDGTYYKFEAMPSTIPLEAM